MINLPSLKPHLQTLISCGIDDVMIDGNKIRAMSSCKSMLIAHETELHNSDMIVLKDLKPIVEKLSLITPSHKLECTPSLDNTYVSRLIATGPRHTKISIRCSLPSAVTAPKKITDEITWKLTLSDDDIEYVKKVVKITQPNTIELMRTDNGIMFVAKDVNRDEFTYEIMDVDSEAPTDFNKKYNTATFMRLLNNTISFTKLGFVTTQVDALSVYVIPVSI